MGFILETYNLLHQLRGNKTNQLTHNIQKTNNFEQITKIATCLAYLTILAYFVYTDSLLVIFKITWLNVIQEVDSFFYFNFTRFENFEILSSVYPTIYFTPITNFGGMFFENTLNLIENFNLSVGISSLVQIAESSFFGREVFSIFYEVRLFLLFFLILIIFLRLSRILNIFFIAVLFYSFFFFIVSSFFLWVGGMDVIQLGYYFDLQVVNSFKNKNLYIDSNYFLTSNTLLGVERFSDVSAPWLVEYKDLGWGLDFDLQDQVSQISERERKYVMEDMNLNFTPNMEDSLKSPGSLSNRLLKLSQRLSTYAEVLSKFLLRFYDNYDIFKNSYNYQIESSYDNWSNISINIFGTKNLENFGNFGIIYTDMGTSIAKGTLHSVDFLKGFLPKVELSNDFVLPKKNNITNRNFSKVGSLLDRKQSVFKKLKSSIPSISKEHSIKSRLPDGTKESNYIFERQLQYERSFELDFKEFLKFRFSERSANYFFNSNTLPLSSKLTKQGRNSGYEVSFLSNAEKEQGTLGLEKFPENNFIKRYSQVDLHFENLLKYWSDRSRQHSFVESRDLEFVYFKNTERFVSSFFSNSDIVLETLGGLLDYNSLGLGMFTYQGYGSDVWFSFGGENFDIFNKVLTYNSNNTAILWWEEKNVENFQKRLANFVDFYFSNLSFFDKKKIVIELSGIASEVWFDFEGSGVHPNINDICRIALSEFLAGNDLSNDRAQFSKSWVGEKIEERLVREGGLLKNQKFKEFLGSTAYVSRFLNSVTSDNYVSLPSQLQRPLDLKNRRSGFTSLSKDANYFIVILRRNLFENLNFIFFKKYFARQISGRFTHYFIKNADTLQGFGWKIFKFTNFSFFILAKAGDISYEGDKYFNFNSVGSVFIFNFQDFFKIMSNFIDKFEWKELFTFKKLLFFLSEALTYQSLYNGFFIFISSFSLFWLKIKLIGCFTVSFFVFYFSNFYISHFDYLLFTYTYGLGLFFEKVYKCVYIYDCNFQFFIKPTTALLQCVARYLAFLTNEFGLYRSGYCYGYVYTVFINFYTESVSTLDTILIESAIKTKHVALYSFYKLPTSAITFDFLSIYTGAENCFDLFFFDIVRFSQIKQIKINKFFNHYSGVNLVLLVKQKIWICFLNFFYLIFFKSSLLLQSSEYVWFFKRIESLKIYTDLTYARIFGKCAIFGIDKTDLVVVFGLIKKEMRVWLACMYLYFVDKAWLVLLEFFNYFLKKSWPSVSFFIQTPSGVINFGKNLAINPNSTIYDIFYLLKLMCKKKTNQTITKSFGVLGLYNNFNTPQKSHACSIYDFFLFLGANTNPQLTTRLTKNQVNHFQVGSTLWVGQALPAQVAYLCGSNLSALENSCKSKITDANLFYTFMGKSEISLAVNKKSVESVRFLIPKPRWGGIGAALLSKNNKSPRSYPHCAGFLTTSWQNGYSSFNKKNILVNPIYKHNTTQIHEILQIGHILDFCGRLDVSYKSPVAAGLLLYESTIKNFAMYFKNTIKLPTAKTFSFWFFNLKKKIPEIFETYQSYVTNFNISHIEGQTKLHNFSLRGSFFEVGAHTNLSNISPEVKGQKLAKLGSYSNIEFGSAGFDFIRGKKYNKNITPYNSSTSSMQLPVDRQGNFAENRQIVYKRCLKKRLRNVKKKLPALKQAWAGSGNRSSYFGFEFVNNLNFDTNFYFKNISNFYFNSYRITPKNQPIFIGMSNTQRFEFLKKNQLHVFTTGNPNVNNSVVAVHNTTHALFSFLFCMFNFFFTKFSYKTSNDWVFIFWDLIDILIFNWNTDFFRLNLLSLDSTDIIAVYGLSCFNNYFYRFILCSTIWAKPFIVSDYILKYFSDFSYIYSIYLLERQYFLFNCFSFEFLINNYPNSLIFDLIRFFCNVYSVVMKLNYLFLFTYQYFLYIADALSLSVRVVESSLNSKVSLLFYRFVSANVSDFFLQNTLIFLGASDYSKVTVSLQLVFRPQLPIKEFSEQNLSYADRLSVEDALKYYYFGAMYYTANTLHILQYVFVNYLVILSSGFSFFYFLFFYTDLNLSSHSFRLIPFFDSMLSEYSTLNSVGNITSFVYFLDVYGEIKDFLFLSLVFSTRNYFEFFGQLVWLDVCIFFDFLFERLVEFDTMTDVNPMSDTIFTLLESVRGLLAGNLLDKLPFFFFKFFEKDGWEDDDDERFHYAAQNDDDISDDSSYGLSDIEDMSSFDFLGWGSNVSIGTDPGNEFSTLNDIVDFPVELEKFFLTDVSDFYNHIFGLDSPKIGSVAPSFDITLPINSLWLVNVLYYNPNFGGIIFIDLSSLLDFIKILYLDKRVGVFSKIYNMFDFSIFNFRDSWFLFFKIKVNYFFIDLLQIYDSIFFNPVDLFSFLYFYLVYLTSYFGVSLPVFMYIFLFYFSKFSKFFERTGRGSNFSTFFTISTLSHNISYFVFRYFYFFVTNSFLFLKMSAIVTVFLSILYVFSEGLHLFSILRVYSNDQDSLLNINGMFFNLERDPFVEKHNPVDEVWDQFKYESGIDDDWSRTHYYRDSAEILGGELENSTVIDLLGFSRKHSFLHYLDEQDDEFSSSVSHLTRAIPQQIHNRVPDEASFMPKFAKDSILEREFFRESELYGPEVEGSFGWASRSANVINTLEDNWRFTNWFTAKHIVESDNYSQWNWGFSRDNEDYYNDLYDALLLNIADPKWLFDSSNILSMYDLKPAVFNHSGIQLYNTELSSFDRKAIVEQAASNTIENIFDRNAGIVDRQPVYDFFYANPLSDLGIDNYRMTGSSIGTVSNSVPTYDDANADVITQFSKHSIDRSVGQPIYFNFADSSDLSDLDFSSSEKFILENYFDTIYKTKLKKKSVKNYANMTEKFKSRFKKKKIQNFSNFDNFYTRMGKNRILENNFKVKKFVKDGVPEGYFNLTSYVFRDLSNFNKELPTLDNLQNLTLENTRRRDIFYSKLSGTNPNTIYYDSMISNDIDKLVYYNYDSIFGKFNSYSKYFSDNEYVMKFDLSEPNQYWTARKFPRTRWKWKRKWGYDSPFQDYVEEDRVDDKDQVLIAMKKQKFDDNAYDTFTLGRGSVDAAVRKKKPYFRKKKLPLTASVDFSNKYPFFKFKKDLGVGPKIAILGKSTTTGSVSEGQSKVSYFLDNPTSNWVSSGPFGKDFFKKEPLAGFSEKLLESRLDRMGKYFFFYKNNTKTEKNKIKPSKNSNIEDFGLFPIFLEKYKKKHELGVVGSFGGRPSFFFLKDRSFFFEANNNRFFKKFIKLKEGGLNHNQPEVGVIEKYFNRYASSVSEDSTNISKKSKPSNSGVGKGKGGKFRNLDTATSIKNVFSINNRYYLNEGEFVRKRGQYNNEILIHFFDNFRSLEKIKKSKSILSSPLILSNTVRSVEQPQRSLGYNFIRFKNRSFIGKIGNFLKNRKKHSALDKEIDGGFIFLKKNKKAISVGSAEAFHTIVADKKNWKFKNYEIPKFLEKFDKNYKFNNIGIARLVRTVCDRDSIVIKNKQRGGVDIRAMKKVNKGGVGLLGLPKYKRQQLNFKWDLKKKKLNPAAENITTPKTIADQDFRVSKFLEWWHDDMESGKNLSLDGNFDVVRTGPQTQTRSINKKSNSGGIGELLSIENRKNMVGLGSDLSFIKTYRRSGESLGPVTRVRFLLGSNKRPNLVLKDQEGANSDSLKLFFIEKNAKKLWDMDKLVKSTKSQDFKNSTSRESKFHKLGRILEAKSRSFKTMKIHTGGILSTSAPIGKGRPNSGTVWSKIVQMRNDKFLNFSKLNMRNQKTKDLGDFKFFFFLKLRTGFLKVGTPLSKPDVKSKIKKIEILNQVETVFTKNRYKNLTNKNTTTQNHKYNKNGKSFGTLSNYLDNLENNNIRNKTTAPMLAHLETSPYLFPSKSILAKLGLRGGRYRLSDRVGGGLFFLEGQGYEVLGSNGLVDFDRKPDNFNPTKNKTKVPEKKTTLKKLPFLKEVSNTDKVSRFLATKLVLDNKKKTTFAFFKNKTPGLIKEMFFKKKLFFVNTVETPRVLEKSQIIGKNNFINNIFLKNHGEFVNNSYRKKIQEYLLSNSEVIDSFSKNGVYRNSQTKKNINEALFLNKSWSIDPSRKALYNLKTTDFIKNDKKNLTDLRDQGLVSWYKKKDFLKSIWKSRKSRRFNDIRGSQQNNSRWPLSYRMHGLILPKYSENPIFVSDGESNRDYVEMYNPNFARRYNDLEVIGDGFVRELEYFREFNLNPIEQGRYYPELHWAPGGRTKRDKRRFSTLENHDRLIANDSFSYYGISDTDRDIFKVIRDKGYFRQFKLRGGDGYGDLYNHGLAEKILNVFDSEYFNKKTNWISPDIASSGLAKPWGLSIDTKRGWVGSQHWSIQKHFKKLNKLFSSPNYRVFGKGPKSISKKKKTSLNFDLGVKKGQTSGDGGTVVGLPSELVGKNYENIVRPHNNWFFNNYEFQGLYEKNFNNNLDPVWNYRRKSKANSNLRLDFDIHKNRERNLYGILVYPEHRRSSVDRNFNSEIKHEWRTKFFQYGKMFRSLEQGAVLQDYFSKNIALSARAITPRQINDFFWNTYKPIKKNKFRNFFKNFNLSGRQNSINNRLQVNSWDISIKNPTTVQRVDIFGDSPSLKNKMAVFQSLGKNWNSASFRSKMSQKKQNFSLGQFETYDGPEVSLENISPKLGIKNSLFSIKKLYKIGHNSHYDAHKVEKINFRTSDWQKLIGILERGSFSKINKRNWWFLKPKLTKNKTSYGGRLNYTIDHLFGSYKKYKKYKNPLFDNNNATSRVVAIEELKKKGVKSSKLDVSAQKFKPQFTKSENLSDAIRSVYEIPFDQRVFQKDESPLDFSGFSEKTLVSGSSFFEDMGEVESNLDFFKNLNISSREKVRVAALVDNLEDYVEPGDQIPSQYSNNTFQTKYYNDYLFGNYNQLNTAHLGVLESSDSSQNYNNTQSVDYKPEFEDASEFYKDSTSFLSNQNNATNWLVNSKLKSSDYGSDIYFGDIPDAGSTNKRNFGGFLEFQKKIPEKSPFFENKSNWDSAVALQGSDFTRPVLSKWANILGSRRLRLGYYNKKQNSNYSVGNRDSMLKVPVLVKDSSGLKLSSLVGGSILGGESNLRSALDFNLKVPENSNTIYNISSSTKFTNAGRKKNKISIDSNIFHNGGVKKILGFGRSNTYVDNNSALSPSKNGYLSDSLSFTELPHDLGSSGDTAFSDFYDKRKMLQPTVRVSLSVPPKTSASSFLSALSADSQNFFFNNVSFLANDSHASTNLFIQKQEHYPETGIFSTSPDSPSSKKLPILERSTSGILGSTSSVSDTTYLNKFAKVSPAFGSNRYKLSYSGDPLPYKSPTPNNQKDSFVSDNLFSFGIPKIIGGFSKGGVSKKETQHYFKYRDNLSYVQKSVSNFFLNSDPESTESDNEYVNNVSTGVVKNLANNFFVNSKSKPNLGKNIEQKQEYQTPDTVSYHISSIFKNSKTNTPQHLGKINRDGYRLFSANESIYPLPVQRSLSIDSKLFNKISSLRLYGSGRLNDYLYRPKLKHLIKNQTNFYNFNLKSSDVGFSPEDDIFLHKFEDFDHTFEPTSDRLQDFYTTKPIRSFSTEKSWDFEGFDQHVNKTFELTEMEQSDSPTQDRQKATNRLEFVGKFYNDYIDDEDVSGDIDDNFYEDNEDPWYTLDTDYDFEINSSTPESDHLSLWRLQNHQVSDIADTNNLFDSSKKYVNIRAGTQIKRKINQDRTRLGDIFEDIDDVDDSLSEERKDLNNGTGFIDKDLWLFNTYKQLSNITTSASKNPWMYGDGLGARGGRFESLDKNWESTRDRNFSETVNNIGSLSLASKTWDYSGVSGNLSFPVSRASTLEHVDQKPTGSLDSIFESYVFNFKKEKEYDEPFDDYNAELGKLQSFLDNRFPGLYVPSEKVDKMIWHDFNKYGQSADSLSYENLDFRRRALDSYSGFFSKKSILGGVGKYSYNVPKKYLDKSEFFSNLSRSDTVSQRDWGTNNSPFSNEISTLYGSLSNYFSDSLQSSTSSLHKLKLINSQQANLVKRDLANYVVKSQGAVGIDRFLDFYNKKNIENLKSNEQFPDYYFKNKIFRPIWNVYNGVFENSVWKKKNFLAGIDQMSTSEKNKSLDLINSLFFNTSNYLVKKNILGLSKPRNADSADNLSIFLRKTNSISNAQFGRRKFKKLKKKYWNRLDIIERYLSNLKKNIKTQIPIKKVNKNFGKPIHSNLVTFLQKRGLFASEGSLNFSIDKNSETYQNTNVFSFENNKNYVQPHLQKPSARRSGFFQDNFNSSETKLPKNYQKINSKFQLLYNASPGSTPDNQIHTQDFLNSDLPINSASYLSFKFGESASSPETDFINNKAFLRIDDPVDSDQEGEDSFLSYSKVRNQFPKLQVGQFSNSYLPLPIVSTFLAKLPHTAKHGIVDESPKFVNFFKNKKKYQENQEPYPVTFFNNDNAFSKINTIGYFKKSPIVDQFSIYHKNLKRPGIGLRDNFSKLPVAPFRPFSSFSTIEDRAVKYGISNYLYKNGPISRRSYDLAIRKFGPDFRTNATMAGYGQFDEISDFNLNSEEDSGLHNNLGYPILNEQNLYVYDFPQILPSFGSDSIFGDGFLEFVWRGTKKVKYPQKNKNSNKSKFKMPIFGHITGTSKVSSNQWDRSRVFLNSSALSYWNRAVKLLKKREDVRTDYNFEPNFTKYVQVWNSTIPRKFKNRKSPYNGKKDKYYEDRLYNRMFSQNFNKEEAKDSVSNSYAHTHNKDYPSDVLSSFQLSTDRVWDSFSSKNRFGPFFEKKVTVPLSRDTQEKNIGPLGFEEGDSLYDNRLLNRGWFPEKIALNLGLRGQSKVGSDMSTLELLSDYSHSFTHDLDNFGPFAELEGLKSLSWAGKGNKIFNAIDDLVEGFGLEENVPFKPSTARELWEWEEYVERPTYEDFDLSDFKFNEDDEDEYFLNWNDPDEYHKFKDDNFSTLHMANYVAETNSWLDSRYFGNVDSAYIPGTSLALADNNLYDGLVSDFTSFVYEKFPLNPSSGSVPNSLPLPTDGLFSRRDMVDSTVPQFSEYVNFKVFSEKFKVGRGVRNKRRGTESQFHTLDTFKPKDTFNFAPYKSGSLRFDAEWVVNGEGWLGNSGSQIPIISNKNIPHSYIKPESTAFTQPKGIHSFTISDDSDMFLGEDSPYFSLSDYQNNRIVRGRDNDVSNFPIKSGWNLFTKVIPNGMNSMWSNRVGSKSFTDFEEDNADFAMDTQNYSEFEEALGIFSGEGFQFSDRLEDNPDFIVFDSSAVNQRDLWWRSVSSGTLTSQSKKELANSLISDSGESYRNFLNSYDYRIFAKSWLNPQEVAMPLKSVSFYGDSQINDFLTSQETGSSKKMDKNGHFSAMSDFSYGFFLTSQKNWDANTSFFSIKLRHYLFKMYVILVTYVSYLQSSLTGKLYIFFYFFLFELLYKFDIIFFFINNFIFLFNSSYYFNVYFIKTVIYFLKSFLSILNLIVYFFIKFQITVTISEDGNIFKFLSTMREYFVLNFYFFEFYFFSSFVGYFLVFLLLYFLFILLLVVI